MSVRDRGGLTNPHERLPDIELPILSGDGSARVRSPGRTSRVLLLLHGGECAACSTYVARLAEHENELEGWDARLLIVVAAGTMAHASLPRGATIVVDVEERLAPVLSVTVPAVVIADQWGEIHAAEGAGTDHRFPEAAEIVEWARYLAVQCPECQGEAL